MRILLVDDDDILTQTLASFLISQRYAVDVAVDGEAGWNYAQAAAYDLIVLDINLPKVDGIRLCQRLRQAKYSNPILLLTAKGNNSDKVVGLDAGADDYLVKPCTTEELAARIRALLRRQNTFANPVLTWGDICLDPGTCEVTYQGHHLTLSPKEYGLLELFLRNPQRIFSSSVILEHLWGFEDAPGEETIRTHIKRLRRKFKAVGAEDVIDTVYGMGYRLRPLTDLTPRMPSVTTATPEPSAADQARAAVSALWEQFKPPIMERLASLDQAVAALHQGHLSEELRQTAVGNAHKLSGSLGMFGFPTGSRLSLEIEQWLRTECPQDLHHMEELLGHLHQELQKAPHSSGDASCRDREEFSTPPDSPIPSSHMSPQIQPELLGQDTASTKVKVLAVDDDTLILESLRQALPRWGICPVTLNNPLQLWDVLKQELPDLLILDVDMPQINGIELCRLIRSNHEWNRLPILFLTAHRDSETTLQLYSAGADDYVPKPFTEPEVVARIFNRLERNRLLRT